MTIASNTLAQKRLFSDFAVMKLDWIALRVFIGTEDIVLVADSGILGIVTTKHQDVTIEVFSAY